MQPIASPVSFKTIAHVVSLWKYVWIISRLSSTDLCAGHPARGPTSGSEAYLKSASASDSCQWRSKILSVSIRLFQCLQLFTMCAYPSQSVKISIHSCTFSKNLPIRRLMPFFIILLICPVFILLLIHVQIRHQRNISAKIQNNIQKCDYRDGYVEVSCVIIILSFTS